MGISLKDGEKVTGNQAPSVALYNASTGTSKQIKATITFGKDYAGDMEFDVSKAWRKKVEEKFGKLEQSVTFDTTVIVGKGGKCQCKQVKSKTFSFNDNNNESDSDGSSDADTK